MSTVACVLVGTVVVIGGTQLLLYGPRDPAPFMTPIHLAGARSYFLNADSRGFMDLAHHPAKILDPHSFRQSRPGYVYASAILTSVLGPAAQHIGLDRAFGEKDSAYFPLILINAALVLAAAITLALLLRRLGAPPVVVATLTLVLAVNDMTRLFFWTPHQQMFVLVVPLATIALGAWFIRARPSPRLAAVVGLVIGVSSLAYGSVLIAIGVCSIILMARKNDRWTVLGAFWGGFLVPQVIWIAICKIVAGSYYSGEVSGYHEFVWPRYAASDGIHALAAAFEANVVMTVRGFLAANGFLLLLLAMLIAIAVLSGVRLEPSTPDERGLLIATGLTIGLSPLFAFGVGVGIWRVIYHVFPAVLLLIGWVSGKLVGSPVLRWRMAVLLVPVAGTALALHVITGA